MSVMVAAGVTRPLATGAQGDGVRKIEMDQIVIEAGSEAFEMLRAALSAAEPKVRKISLDVREDGVAVKVNEYGWTPTLSVRAER